MKFKEILKKFNNKYIIVTLIFVVIILFIDQYNVFNQAKTLKKLNKGKAQVEFNEAEIEKNQDPCGYFNIFFNRVTKALNTNSKKYNFKLYMLETTQYNYKEISKMYKEQVQIGYSKMLPQVALGHSQSSILNTAYFENEILHLSEIMIPPLMSSTLSGEDILGNKTQSNTSKTQKTSEANSGRPKKEEGQLSEKTIQNKESMN